MIYFDNSATTKPHQDVLDAYIKVSSDMYGNASSLHNFGGKSEQLLTRAREQIANLCDVKPAEIYFTSGGTEGNNLAIKGAAFMHRGRGNHIITTAIEHPSVKEPCEQLKSMGFDITYLPVNKNGVVSVFDLKAAITEQTTLVSIMYVNNETGSIQPIGEIGRLLKNYPKILFHVDFVQAAGKLPIDIYELFLDLCTFSAHKFHGLKGTGFLFKRQGVKLEPLISGGNQELKMRSGTENTGGIVAMAKALRLVELNRKNKGAELLRIHRFLYDRLQAIPSIIIHTPVIAAPHIINFSAQGLKGEVLVHALEEEGIVLSTTSACSSKDKLPSTTLKSMGVSGELAIGAVRISLSYGNTLEEAEIFFQALSKILQRLNKVMRRI
ncbi:cysteine desulfurase family protein [Bacillus sp. FSL K6-3431]|uniref:cysteine desulfurase family protein n=1 Tax=Bacillus sp. FSL K6-3431 TaxID=2921500 RepID=UPI0030FAC20A